MNPDTNIHSCISSTHPLKSREKQAKTHDEIAASYHRHNIKIKGHGVESVPTLGGYEQYLICTHVYIYFPTRTT